MYANSLDQVDKNLAIVPNQALNEETVGICRAHDSLFQLRPDFLTGKNVGQGHHITQPSRK
jgi:hypothetical protein